MVMKRDSSSSSLYSLFSYDHLLEKCPISPQLKHLKGILPLYLLGPPFRFLTNCSSFVSNS
jgi:hypothetical protein